MILFLLGLLLGNTNAATDYEQLEQKFRSTLSEMVATNTTNPPGNESRVVAIIARRLKKEGIPFEITEFAPGRENIVARVKGSGKLKPILLLAHTDVVGTSDQAWSTKNPHEVTEKNGVLIGRGVTDDLGMAALELELLIHLHKNQTNLKRDVVVALTGDEESGGLGIRYLLEHRPESIDAALALNEGGGVVLGSDGKVYSVDLQVAEKTYQDFEIRATGPTGHSSVPLKDNAIYRLSQALSRFEKNPWPERLIPVTRAYLAETAKLEKKPLSVAMRLAANTQGSIPKRALQVLEADPTIAANLRTTCVATLLTGGTKENALPATARATLNCRILPDETSEDVRLRIVKILKDPRLEVVPVGEFSSAGASPVDGEGPVAIRKIVGEMWPSVPVIPFLSRGATDSRFLRAIGMPCYGIDPLAVTQEDSRRAHGIDEQLPIASIRPGLEFLHRLILELAAENKNPFSAE